MNFLNKKVLLFVPRGKGIYGTGISEELERRGSIVKVFDERPNQSTIVKIALRLAKKYIQPYLYRYFREIIKDNRTIEFDYVFIIRGEGLTPRIVQMLRDTYNDAIFLLYLWDSLKSNNIEKVFPFFDKVFSFDKADVDKHSKLIFRPLFFLPEYRLIADKKEKPIDIIFIGTVHSDRYSFIKNVQYLYASLNLTTFFYFYFPSKILFIRKKITDSAFRRSKLNDFSYTMLSAKQVSNYISQAKASLDVEGPGQTGLTMRTIEILGAKRKLITTNQTIKSYDFYDEKNIMIVERNNPKIDPSFIFSPYVEIPNEIYERYSIEGWIEEIFS